MPIKIPDDLPAVGILASENIFLMSQSTATQQDIRPLRILLLNLMPKKIETETHFLRMLSNSPLQIELELVCITKHQSQHTPKQHTDNFYRTFAEIKQQNYDGMIITGAPLGLIDFEQVDYWQDLIEIMDWTQTHVTSTVFICWAALAAAWHFHGIRKLRSSSKLVGVFEHSVTDKNCALVRGADDLFWAPHSRNSHLDPIQLEKCTELEIISDSKVAGPYLLMSKKGRQIYILGHAEYDPQCLKNEYLRDRADNINADMPQNYFPNDDCEKEPIVRWRSHGHMLFSNWLNYYVYQQTPFKF